MSFSLKSHVDVNLGRSSHLKSGEHWNLCSSSKVILGIYTANCVVRLAGCGYVSSLVYLLLNKRCKMWFVDCSYMHYTSQVRGAQQCHSLPFSCGQRTPGQYYCTCNALVYLSQAFQRQHLSLARWLSEPKIYHHDPNVLSL